MMESSAEVEKMGKFLQAYFRYWAHRQLQVVTWAACSPCGSMRFFLFFILFISNGWVSKERRKRERKKSHLFFLKSIHLVTIFHSMLLIYDPIKREFDFQAKFRRSSWGLERGKQQVLITGFWWKRLQSPCSCEISSWVSLLKHFISGFDWKRLEMCPSLCIDAFGGSHGQQCEMGLLDFNVWEVYGG